MMKKSTPQQSRHVLKRVLPCLCVAEMQKAPRLKYWEQHWVHIVRLVLNVKPPRRRGGQKRNRRSLQLSESQSLCDYIASEVAAFLSAPEGSIQDVFAEVGDNVHDPGFVG